jgi:hypothetical protein
VGAGCCPAGIMGGDTGAIAPGRIITLLLIRCPGIVAGLVDIGGNPGFALDSTATPLPGVGSCCPGRGTAPGTPPGSIAIPVLGMEGCPGKGTAPGTPPGGITPGLTIIMFVLGTDDGCPGCIPDGTAPAKLLAVMGCVGGTKLGAMGVGTVGGVGDVGMLLGAAAKGLGIEPCPLP